MPSVWDHKLWDTFNPQLYNFTKYNQDFLKQYSDFLERRGKIEEKYAKDLRKLCKEFRTKEYDKKEKIKFSVQTSFDEMLAELVSSANQHDTLRDELLKSSKEVKDALREAQRQSQQTEKKVAGLVKDLERNRNQLEGVRSQYQRSFVEMKKAREDYIANKDNKDITKNEEERFQQVFLHKQSMFEERKQSYAKELSDYNTAQSRHYMEHLPEQLATLEEQEKRVAAICKQHFQLWGDSELQALNIRTKCCQTLRQKADNVNAEYDINEFMRVTASGNPVPDDVVFEDLGSNDSISQQQQQQQAAAPGKKNKFGTLNKKSAPAQQKRRLVEQLKQKDEELEKATKGLDAMHKLLQTYQQNPKLGDIAMVQQQMQQASEQVETLNRERVDILKELQALGVDTSNMGGAAPVATTAAAPPPVQAVSGSQNTSSASAFADEFADESPVSPAQPQPVATSAGAAGPPQAPPVPPPPSAVAAPALPIVAMLYDFNDPSQSDNLAVVAGERLYVLSGDADWTLVQRTAGNTDEQGYVPTAYMGDV
ncbi:hypothetical protein BOX15_Mlig009137g1 [Macrostomum lignano]|uniref:SH3 domain-containing protein n=2 Tax=Macrostomum lignano TaxID=282301 RepID=A0A267G4L2_9PLAT|nr:hypothetical protein BOX15_Mlig009137g1 [Macrostomum lignano]